MAGVAGVVSAKIPIEKHLTAFAQIYDQAFNKVSSNSRKAQVEPMMFDGVACQYWWNNKWYNLQEFNKDSYF
jgi:hypothetical protein